MASLPTPPRLAVVIAPNGARFTVAADYAPRFQGLINDLSSSNYTIDPTQSGGYNPRFIAGATTPSEHAFGRAIDVNWTRNPQGSTGGDLPPDLAHQLATKYGMTWGGDWTGKTRDAMHFEISGHPTDPSAPATVTATPPAPDTTSPIDLTQMPTVSNPVSGGLPIGPPAATQPTQPPARYAPSLGDAISQFAQNYQQGVNSRFFPGRKSLG